MTSLSLSSARSLLECYLHAKDQNRPELIAQCFAAEATLTFSIATDSIDFPRSVTGTDAIAKTLVSDFGERFDRCRTYYVCVEPSLDADGVCIMPWLVVMREKETETLRLGKGAYRWRMGRATGGAERIVGLHIHIERMDTIADSGSVKLGALQDALTYPWMPTAMLMRGIQAFEKTCANSAFVAAFREPSSTDAVRG
ncbi:nuclear transport factor 2 family protein [Paraburkholderia sacchari]|uniref:nuclear transport factor 2 family protein n=1 Tax=Paraburkholderia sacchari TaxID=159450 RepID=UPI000542A043|nr:nuclear transport factor 2 family protein [Paraburkholderia sacchari]NLP63161.1 SnoaL-like domain-containing protein [Paraburkholderia sacchari]